MKKRWILTGAVLAIMACWLLRGNTALTVSNYTITSDRVPEAFSGFRIVQVSDLHNASFGEENRRLLAELEEAEPDIIIFTGDLVDSRRTDMGVALSFAQQAVEIAPCYYVTGNHEARIARLTELLDGLTEAGVTILRNDAVTLIREGDSLVLLGVDDPSFTTDYLTGDGAAVMAEALAALATDAYTILLSHRPELFDIYHQFGVDLVFSGHAHGGQFRLPFVGGLIAPNQGLFPRYDAGRFQKENTSMVVSRGLGASIIPIRIGNPPEIVVTELHREEK